MSINHIIADGATPTLSIRAGTCTLSEGLVLPSVGSTSVSSLNYYENYAHISAFFGPINSTPVVINIVRVGKIVTAYVPATYGTGISVASRLILANALPERFRPATDVVLESPLVISNNVLSVGFAIMQADGVLAFGTAPFSDFAATIGQIGLRQSYAMSWVVQ